MASAYGRKKGGARTDNEGIAKLESTINALNNDQNELFNDSRFKKSLQNRLNFLRRYHNRSASCATGPAPDFYVESNNESIAQSIQAYHDAVFVGTGKKCDRKRSRPHVQNQIKKLTTKGCSKKHGDCSSLHSSNRIAFKKGENIIVGAASKFENDVVVFQNIKYAEHARFEHSITNDFDAYANENGVFDFSSPGKSCITTGGVNIGSKTLPVDTELSEDCLYAKIIARKDSVISSSDEKRNVLAWLHGGTFNFGGADATYESPDNLVAEHDLIVAKLNYRLGAFGNWYFSSDDTNYQMGDQRNGMKWIYSNISKFNGDNENITLGGSSAGGRSVMNHMTSPDSFNYFNNALTIGAQAVPYWQKSEVEEIFKRIYGHISTANAELGGCFNAMPHKTCLQMLPTEDFAQLSGMVGGVYAQFAFEKNKITQAESAWYPVIDGNFITSDPLQKIMAGDVKQDLGIYYHENSRDEGNSMMRQLFKADALRVAIFGENAAQIWQSFNQHVAVPKAAYDGFMQGFYQPMGLDAVVPSQTELACPDAMPGHPASSLLTECLDAVSDWATSYMFTCRSEYTMKNSNFGENSNIFMTENYVGRPGPTLNEENTMQVTTDHMVDCYIRSQGKACHMVGQTQLFGEAFHQGINMNDEEITFIKSYQTMLANLINGKDSGLVEFDKSNPMATLNQIKLDGNSIGPSRPITCSIHDQVFPTLIQLGII